MKRGFFELASVLMLLPILGLVTLATAQQNSASSANQIEPGATDALEKMGAYLRSLKAFQVHSEGTSEAVLDDGQKVQFAQTTNLVARVPDRLMAEIEGDQGSKRYVYDGKTFTLFSPDDGYYGTLPAPPNLRQLFDMLSDKYGVDIPLVDLFLWGQKDNAPPKLTSGMDVGPGEVGGVSCEHYTFRQEGLDWQVWIQQGDFPLPRKLVLTTTTDDARPQHTAVLMWNLAPSYNEATFVFDPPAGTHKIVFKTTSADSGK